MEPTFWRERWETGRIGWHEAQPNRFLVEHADALTRGQSARVLVPLCGKTRDMAYLAADGHHVVGIDLVEQAAREFFADSNLVPRVTNASRHVSYAGNGVAILVADFFAIDPSEIGPVDCAWDRAAFIALPAEMRARYVPRLLGLLPTGGRILLVTLSYDDTTVAGPPFSVTDEEVRERFGMECTVQMLQIELAQEPPPRLRENGVPSVRECAWLVTKIRDANP